MPRGLFHESRTDNHGSALVGRWEDRIPTEYTFVSVVLYFDIIVCLSDHEK